MSVTPPVVVPCITTGTKGTDSLEALVATLPVMKLVWAKDRNPVAMKKSVRKILIGCFRRFKGDKTVFEVFCSLGGRIIRNKVLQDKCCGAVALGEGRYVYSGFF